MEKKMTYIQQVGRATRSNVCNPPCRKEAAPMQYWPFEPVVFKNVPDTEVKSPENMHSWYGFI